MNMIKQIEELQQKADMYDNQKKGNAEIYRSLCSVEKAIIDLKDKFKPLDYSKLKFDKGRTKIDFAGIMKTLYTSLKIDDTKQVSSTDIEKEFGLNKLRANYVIQNLRKMSGIVKRREGRNVYFYYESAHDNLLERD